MSISFIKYFPLVIVSVATGLSVWVYFEEPNRILALTLIFLSSVVVVAKEIKTFLKYKNSSWLKDLK